jgi:hypothetical protein
MAHFTYVAPTSTDELKKVYKDFHAHIGNAREELKEATKKFVNDWAKYHGVMFLQDSGLKTKLRSEKIDGRLADYMAEANFLAKRDWDSFIAEGPSRPFEAYADGLRYFIDCADEYLTAANKTKATMSKYAA